MFRQIKSDLKWKPQIVPKTATTMMMELELGWPCLRAHCRRHSTRAAETKGARELSLHHQAHLLFTVYNTWTGGAMPPLHARMRVRMGNIFSVARFGWWF